jgi:hypothetical protein
VLGITGSLLLVYLADIGQPLSASSDVLPDSSECKTGYGVGQWPCKRCPPENECCCMIAPGWCKAPTEATTARRIFKLTKDEIKQRDNVSSLRIFFFPLEAGLPLLKYS